MIEIIPNWHPIFVHFALALWTVAVVFFLLAILWKGHRWRPQWLQVAYWNMWLGAIFAVITAVAGWRAFNSVAHDAISHVAMEEHRNWALATLAIMLPLSAWSAWRYSRGSAPGTAFLIALLIGFGLLVSTGWHGGELVYRYGLGVMSLPAAEGEGHHHDHPDAMGAHEHLSGATTDADESVHTHAHEHGSVHEH